MIHSITISDLLTDPAFPELLAANGVESAIAGLPGVQPNLQRYRRLEMGGELHTFGDFAGAVLVGYAVLLTTVLPHYDRRVGVVESLFVAATHRKGGAGDRLIKAVETRARACGCAGLLASAPSDSRLCTILPRRGYRETNRVFFKPLA